MLECFLPPKVLSGFMVGQGGMRMTWQKGVRGHRVRAGLRYKGPVSHKETGEGSCHSLSADHSTEP